MAVFITTSLSNHLLICLLSHNNDFTSVHLSADILVSLGATKLSVGLFKGAEATGRAINRGGAKIRDSITPEDTPSEVSPNVTKGLHATKQATGGVLRVSQFLGKNLQTKGLKIIPKRL